MNNFYKTNQAQPKESEPHQNIRWPSLPSFELAEPQFLYLQIGDKKCYLALIDFLENNKKKSHVKCLAQFLTPHRQSRNISYCS